MNFAVAPSGNALLATQSTDTLSALRPLLEHIELTPGLELEQAGRSVGQVIFPQSGVLSVFAKSDGTAVEVGMVGREGMTGLATVFGVERSSHTVRVQLPGEGLRIGADCFRALLEQHPSLRQVALRYSHAWLTQVSQTGLAAARKSVTERLARWLLMCLDRADGPDLHVTHDALSGALGVRRPGVTVATHMLEGVGAIRARRGCISILDRAKLVRSANGGYGMAEGEYASLLGQPAAPAAERRVLSTGGVLGSISPVMA